MGGFPEAKEFVPLIDRLFEGGPESIIAILVILTILLLWERKRLLDLIARREEKIDAIVENYYQGNMTLTEALNGVKAVMLEVRLKL
ncbi:hypothetical protein [Brevundimonas nasdae]|uniref:Uncharacterized protein n=1 Tax=Brevundimonas nasdae TaxID=172043 RepID=A0ACD4VKK0_9CAUL|nr:hypothetical protein [Brevundimonas nasdae]WOB78469.1 hypothetical protein PZA08_14370 [Brevundimonas nasdae]